MDEATEGAEGALADPAAAAGGVRGLFVRLLVKVGTRRKRPPISHTHSPRSHTPTPPDIIHSLPPIHPPLPSHATPQPPPHHHYHTHNTRPDPFQASGGLSYEEDAERLLLEGVPRRFRLVVRRARDAATLALARHHTAHAAHTALSNAKTLRGPDTSGPGGLGGAGSDHIFAQFIERLLGDSLRVLRRLLFVLRLLETHRRLRTGEKIPLGYSRAPLKEGHKAAVRIPSLIFTTILYI